MRSRRVRSRLPTALRPRSGARRASRTRRPRPSRSSRPRVSRPAASSIRRSRARTPSSRRRSPKAKPRSSAGSRAPAPRWRSRSTAHATSCARRSRPSPSRAPSASSRARSTPTRTAICSIGSRPSSETSRRTNMADFGTIARPYARAAFDTAKEANALEAWSQALAAAAAVVSNEDAERVLASPSLTDDARVELIAEVGAAMPGAELFGDQRFRSLLRLLAENDRLEALPEISAQFDELKAEAENKIDVTLVSATSVEPEIAQKITQALERRLGRQVALKVEIDDKLLGGAIIRAEDMVIDGSVRMRLERLTQTLIAERG